MKSDMKEPKRPDTDATASEIQEWMDEHFAWSVAEGIENVNDGNDRYTIEVETIDHERGEIVGTIDAEGNLDTESEALRDVSQEYLDEGVPVLVPTTYENEEGKTVHADAEVLVEPGKSGFVRAFIDELPSPYDCDPEALDELPIHDADQR